jgi:hypothetical protein
MPEPKSGYTSFIQPTIHPLFKTRAFQTSLLNGVVTIQITKLILRIIGKQSWVQKLHLMRHFKEV